MRWFQPLSGLPSRGLRFVPKGHPGPPASAAATPWCAPFVRPIGLQGRSRLLRPPFQAWRPPAPFLVVLAQPERHCLPAARAPPLGGRQGLADAAPVLLAPGGGRRQPPSATTRRSVRRLQARPGPSPRCSPPALASCVTASLASFVLRTTGDTKGRVPSRSPASGRPGPLPAWPHPGACRTPCGQTLGSGVPRSSARRGPRG